MVNNNNDNDGDDDDDVMIIIMIIIKMIIISICIVPFARGYKALLPIITVPDALRSTKQLRLSILAKDTNASALAPSGARTHGLVISSPALFHLTTHALSKGEDFAVHGL